MSDDNTIDEMIADDPELLESFVSESRDCLLAAEDDLNAVFARGLFFCPVCIGKYPGHCRHRYCQVRGKGPVQNIQTLP